MRLHIFFLKFFILLLLIGCESEREVIEADYSVIPLPQEMVPFNRELFGLNRKTKISYSSGSEVQKQTAEFLAEYIKTNTRLNLEITDQPQTKNAIILKTGYDGKPQSYNLTVNKDLIIINGADEAGIFYGVQLLRKAIPANSKKFTVAFPGVDIKDYPRFEYRNVMLDLEYAFSVEMFKNYIDILALHNINGFNWKLTKNNTFRMEITNYPELTGVGNKEKQSEKSVYTKEEVKEIVAYAQKRFISVIPEIDLAECMAAALPFYPQLGCSNSGLSKEEKVFCAGDPSTYVFLENVLNEITDVFSSEFVYVKSGEFSKNGWKNCFKCQEKIKEEGLRRDMHRSAEDKLQDYMYSRMEAFLKSKGRKMIVSDVVYHSPASSSLIWHVYNDEMTGNQTGNKDVVLRSYVNFDYPDTQGKYLPVESVYEFDPVSSTLSPEYRKCILGTEVSLWAANITDSKQIEYILMPRISALAEGQWVLPEKKDFLSFLSRLSALAKIYDQLDYDYISQVTSVYADIKPDTLEGVIRVKLSNYGNAPVFYTLDGTEPGKQSVLYTEPIALDTSTTLKAVAIRKKEVGEVHSESFLFNKATAKPIQLQYPPFPKYSYGGVLTLVDGRKGSGDPADGSWIGFYDTDVVALIDLKEESEISDVSLGTYLNPEENMFGITHYTVHVSSDNKRFKWVFEQRYPIIPENTPVGSVEVKAAFPAETARYVKILVRGTKSVPFWHPEKGKPAFLFIDEVSVN